MSQSEQERLSSIESSVQHISRVVDRLDDARDATSTRLARLEARVDHLSTSIPDVARSSEKNAAHNAKADGWQDAKQDSERDSRAHWAIIVSVVSLGLTLAANIVRWSS